jgi:hypothetical protein
VPSVCPAKDVGDPTLGGGKAECAIGGRDQPPGKADPFGLVAVEQIVGRMAVQDRRQLPGKINGVANSSWTVVRAGWCGDAEGRLHLHAALCYPGIWTF